MLLSLLLSCRRLRCGYPFRKIPLTQGKFAIVDPQDYRRLNRYKWCAARDKNTFYAVRSKARKQIRMHRRILNVPAHLICDHINHNGLDNRISNLRICTRQQNTHNQRPRKTTSSRYKGVDWNKHQKKWRARIYHNNRCHHLGCFCDERDAARAYDRAARKYHGDFASLNFPASPSR